MVNKEYLTKDVSEAYSTKSVIVVHPAGHQFVVSPEELKKLLVLNGFKTKKAAKEAGWRIV